MNECGSCGEEKFLVSSIRVTTGHDWITEKGYCEHCWENIVYPKMQWFFRSSNKLNNHTEIPYY